MSGPGRPLQAVADLRRCLEARDWAGAERLVCRPETLEGLAALLDLAGGALAGVAEAHREAAAARLIGEAEQARVQARVRPLLDELIGVLAKALAEDERERSRAA